MQVVSVVTLHENSVQDIISFNGDGHEEVSKAESKFKEIVNSFFDGYSENQLNIFVEDGHFEIGNSAVNICWSSI